MLAVLRLRVVQRAKAAKQESDRIRSAQVIRHPTSDI